MNKYFYLILTALFSLCVQLGLCTTVKIDSLRYEVLMSHKMLNENHFNDTFIHSMDITGDRLFLISTSNQFHLLGWGGLKQIGNKLTNPINSFAYTPEGFLMVISKNELCYFDSLGNINKLFTLPTEGMRISAGKGVMYIYDCKASQPTHALYVLAPGGKYIKLFDAPSPIQSVVEMGNTLLIACKNGVFKFTPGNKELKLLVGVPGNKTIKSLAVDTTNNRIYFSTDSIICALKDTDKVLITDKFGGILRYFNKGLIVFNTEKSFLVRLVNIENQITAGIQSRKNTSSITSSEKVITNETIIDLVKNNLSDELIIKIINRSKVNFNLSVDSMISLAGQHVSSPVIKAMKQASKKQGTSTQKNSL